VIVHATMGDLDDEYDYDVTIVAWAKNVCIVPMEIFDIMCEGDNVRILESKTTVLM